MTSPMQLYPKVMHNRIVNHLWVNKTPFTDASTANPLSRKHYSWRLSKAEAMQIRATELRRNHAAYRKGRED
jgi:hypothetical protein